MYILLKNYFDDCCYKYYTVIDYNLHSTVMCYFLGTSVI